MTKNIRERIRDYSRPWVKPLLSVRVFQSDNSLDLQTHLRNCFTTYRCGRSTDFFKLTIKKIEKEVMAFDPFIEIENYDPVNL